MTRWLRDLWWLARYGILAYCRTPWQLREAVQSVMATADCTGRWKRELTDALPDDGESCWVIEAWFDKGGCGGGYMGPEHIAHSGSARPPAWEVVPTETTTAGSGNAIQLTLRPKGSA